MYFLLGMALLLFAEAYKSRLNVKVPWKVSLPQINLLLRNQSPLTDRSAVPKCVCGENCKCNPCRCAKPGSSLLNIRQKPRLPSALGSTPEINQNTDPSVERAYDDTFGIFSALAQTLDSLTSGFALSYADLSGYSVKDVKAIMFLATNLVYEGAAAASSTLPSFAPADGEGWSTGVGTGMPAAITVAGLVSLYYHWAQLYVP